MSHDAESPEVETLITQYEREIPERVTPGKWEIVVETEAGEFGRVLNRYCVGIREAQGQRRWIVRFDDDYGTNQWADAIHIVDLHNARAERVAETKRLQEQLTTHGHATITELAPPRAAR